MATLPPEVWHHVAAYLPTTRDLVRCVCRLLLAPAHGPSLSLASHWFYEDAGLAAAIRSLHVARIEGAIVAARFVHVYAHLTLGQLRVLEVHGPALPAARACVEDLGRMTGLVSLSLLDASVSPLHLSAISRLTGLTALRLDRCGRLPFSENVFWRDNRLVHIDLAPLTNLRSLSLESCGLGSDQCAFLSRLVQLRSLNLAHNALRTRVVASLLPLTKLRHLDLSHTHITHPSRFWTHLGRQLDERGKAKRALYAYEQALALAPADTQTLWLKACCLNSLKRFDLALACLDTLVTAFPDQLAVRIERGRTLRQLKRYRASVEEFDHVLALDADNVEAWWRKGASLIKVGDFTQAVVCFDRALLLRGDTGRFVISQTDQSGEVRPLRDSLRLIQPGRLQEGPHPLLTWRRHVRPRAPRRGTALLARGTHLPASSASAAPYGR